MTDPTGQQVSETAKCRWCRLPIREVLSDGSAYWTTGNSRTYVGCPANANGHEPAEPVAVPPAPPEMWRCFHCDFFTTIHKEAEAHFGDRDDAEEFKPICKWWANMDEAERRWQLQSIIRELNEVKADNDALVERVRALEGKRA